MNAWMFVWMSIAGAVGTLARFGLQGLVQGRAGTFPWGTFVVNMAGTLAFGLVWGLIEEKIASVPGMPAVRMVVLVGFMGAFTTFSSFMFETGKMLQDGEYLLAAANLAGQNAIGLICFFGGLFAGQALSKVL